MPTVKEITEMCKAGHISEAYELAKADLSNDSENIWKQRAVGWTLYYNIRADVEKGDFQSVISHIDELKELKKLTIRDDNMIFDNVIFKVAELIKKTFVLTDINTYAKLSTIYSRLKEHDFATSKGYSYLLQSVIKFDGWYEMNDFLNWWNLDKLSHDDYEPYKLENGKRIMSLAERAIIAKSKALLQVKDHEQTKQFLPTLDKIMVDHPEMTYPGYFYGRLLLSLGSTADEELRVVIPFARKKETEFWVWQLLSEVFVNEPDKQLACLLRAVHCKTQESFLGKVRIRLSSIYIQRNRLDLAKFQIDKISQCYLSQGWKLPNEVAQWIREPWINSVVSKDENIVDYKIITDSILYHESKESVAIITYIDPTTHKSSMIYGYQKRMSQRINIKCACGTVIKINYAEDGGNKIKLLNAEKCQLPIDLNYAKVIDGHVQKKDDWNFAFVHSGNIKAFVSPTIVERYKVADSDVVKCLVVYDYNTKKSEWNWSCVSIKK